MTDALYITIASADWSAAVERQILAALEGFRPNAIRLSIRTEKTSVLIEPFFASASFAALLGVGRSLDAVRDAVSAIVGEAFRHTDGVGILAQSDRKRGPLAVKEELTDLNGAIAKLLAVKDTWFRLRPPLRTYVASRVEAKLYQPLELESGDVATSYFREYRVLARDAKQTQQMIVEDLANEGSAFLRWQALEVEEVHLEDTDSACVILNRGGRVYFAERGRH